MLRWLRALWFRCKKKGFDTREGEGEDQMLKKQVINEPMEEQVAGLNTTVW
jgi:hypothetical protein